MRGVPPEVIAKMRERFRLAVQKPVVEIGNGDGNGH